MFNMNVNVYVYIILCTKSNVTKYLITQISLNQRLQQLCKILLNVY